MINSFRPIKIRYSVENGFPERYEFSCTLKSAKEVYRLSWKEQRGDDFMPVPEELKEKPITYSRELSVRVVDAKLKKLAEARLLFAPDVNEFCDGPSCALSIEGLSSVSIKISWCSCEITGTPELHEFTGWLESMCTHK